MLGCHAYLTRAEIDAVLATPDCSSGAAWTGHSFFCFRAGYHDAPALIPRAR
jgi:hypothetical protein